MKRYPLQVIMMQHVTHQKHSTSTGFIIKFYLVMQNLRPIPSHNHCTQYSVSAES